jgi:hypothetical protein
MKLRTRTRALLVGLAGLAVSGLAADRAGALAYTIDGNTSLSGLQPITINQSGVVGQILPVTSTAGTNICLAGSCSNPTAQDWLLFQVVLSTGSAAVDEIGGSSVGVSVVLGVGHYSDPNETPTAGQVVASQGLIDYADGVVGPGNLEAGETTDRLFVTFNLGALPGPGLPALMIPAGTASFMISSGANFSVSGAIVQIPEPGLLGALAGLLGLAAAGHRLRR